MPALSEKAPVTGLGFDSAYLSEFEDKLFIEGAGTARKLVNFFSLLLFATIIATFGVLSGSTATVIGAMIVAPLMGPIMATTAAVVLGSPRRALRGLALTLAGIVTVIGCSALLAMLVPSATVSFTDNAEIASRVNPGLLALITALASGAAGAFITSRREIADSMGGVAIAISLVPPLCVVGIAFQKGQSEAALGALLLFLTNFLAILMAGGLTFWLQGLWRSASGESQKRVRFTGLALFLLGTVIVAVPLAVTSVEAIRRTTDTNVATAEAIEWLAGRSYRLISVSMGEQAITFTVEGAGELDPVSDLVDDLAASLGRPVLVTVRTLPALIGSSGNL